MRLGQIKWHNTVTAAIFEDSHARPIPDHNLQQLISRAEQQGEPLPALAKELAQSLRETLDPVIPLQPREIWACGCTYESTPSFPPPHHSTLQRFYAHPYRD